MITLPTRLDLMKMLPSGGLAAEIGVRQGAFSNEILSHCPLRRLYLIDAWKAYEDFKDPCTQEQHDAFFMETKRMASHHGNRAIIIRGFSERVALNNFEIPKLDGVYIDGNHSKEAAKRDLIVWSKRLKPDGVLMGHDYTDQPLAKEYEIQVIEAVTEFCEEYGWVLTHLTDESFASFRLEKAL